MDTLKKKIEINTQFLILQMVIKKVVKIYIEIRDEIKYLIKAINSGKAGEYGKDFMKISSDDNSPLNELLKFHMLTIIVRSAFEEDGKYRQSFLDECLCDF